jgi:hypothetical protein
MHLPLAHLNRMDGVVSGDLMDRLAPNDRLQGDPDMGACSWKNAVANIADLGREEQG